MALHPSIDCSAIAILSMYATESAQYISLVERLVVLVRLYPEDVFPNLYYYVIRFLSLFRPVMHTS